MITLKIFITGATGYVGTKVTKELIDLGHEVVGLARSENSAEKLRTLGASSVTGDLESLSVLTEAAANADAVLHLGFQHNFDEFAKAGQVDKAAILALAAGIKRTNKPLIITSGTAMIGTNANEKQISEDYRMPADQEASTPRKSEYVAYDLIDDGYNVVGIVRLAPSVHGPEDQHGFVRQLAAIAEQNGKSAYIGDGSNRWNAVSQKDAAHLFVLAVDYLLNKEVKLRIFNAVAESAITAKEIAQAIGDYLNVPTVSLTQAESQEQLGFLAGIFALDAPTSSDQTQKELNWTPVEPTLIADLKSGSYFK